MWIWCAIASAVLLGVYDVFKKKALSHNSLMAVLFFSTGLSALFLLPFAIAGRFPMSDGSFVPWTGEWKLLLKSFIVTVSWISGLAGMKYLPLTTAGTLKAFRPVFVVLVSVLFLGERLNLLQSCGIVLAIVSLLTLSSASSREGIRFTRSKGVLYMLISIVSGVSSALLDKFIMRAMPPLYVQSHCNVYITLMLGLILLFSRKRDFVFDWNLVLIAVFITGADFLYFYALSMEGALLSVISVTRRLAVVVTFVLAALVFHERNITRKAFSLALLLTATLLLVLGS